MRDRSATTCNRLAAVALAIDNRLAAAALAIVSLALGCQGSLVGTDADGGGSHVVVRDMNVSALFDLPAPAADLNRPPVVGGCGLRTCASSNATCGLIGDGCGGVLDCGTCASPKTCGGGGTPNVCGPNAACTPRTCAQQGYRCGLAADGCGGIIDCGTCAAPTICGGGGTAFQCGYTPPPDGGVCVNLCQKQVQCPTGTTTISGTVFAPTNPLLGYGQPDPIYGATVYIPNDRVLPFPRGRSCDQCGALVSGNPLVSQVTGADGKFALQNAPCGTNIPLVIQVGRWRRQITIPSVACCQNTALAPEQSRLPRKSSEGDIPLIAVVTGAADPIECVLPKLGIDASEYSLPTGSGRVRFYVANGANFDTGAPSQSVLFGDPAELAKYDAVIADCEGGHFDKSAQWQQNLLDYLNKGGRFFASHFSYTWLYHNGPFAGTATWVPNTASLAGGTGLIDTSFPTGSAFATWLKNVGASTTLGQIPVAQLRNDASHVNNPPAQRWIYLNDDFPLEFTFNTPVGLGVDQQCGRVLFSDFHVQTGGSARGKFPAECGAASPMTPQEKVLEFQLFDLTSCIQTNTPPSLPCSPRGCEEQGVRCGPAGDGCGGVIQCGGCAIGEVCGVGGPSVCGPLCTPQSCAKQGKLCGPAGDGCGGRLDCGSCVAGMTCGGGGSSICGMGSCTPRTCAQQGIECGDGTDGCGKLIECGACPLGQTCGGGGTPFKCGTTVCSPQSCSVVGANCGPIADGCGGTVDCGACRNGQLCGGGGKPNLCG